MADAPITGTDRIESLADGVFAIVMTVLVLGLLDTPAFEADSAAALHRTRFSVAY